MERSWIGVITMQESADVNAGVSRVIQIMNDYDLMKEDWDSIMEVGQFDGIRDPVAAIPSKVCFLCFACNTLAALFILCCAQLFAKNKENIVKFLSKSR